MERYRERLPVDQYPDHVSAQRQDPGLLPGVIVIENKARRQRSMPPAICLMQRADKLGHLPAAMHVAR
jgi:hypothetical protein